MPTWTAVSDEELNLPSPEEDQTMKLAKKAAVLLLLVALVSPICGCGVGTSVAENDRSIRRVTELDSRMLVDDLLLFSEYNRPLRTTRWVTD